MHVGHKLTLSYFINPPGGGEGSLEGLSGLGSGLFSLTPHPSLALLSSLIIGPAAIKSKLGVTGSRYISPLDPPSQDVKEGQDEEDFGLRMVAVMSSGDASLAALNAGLASSRLPAATSLSNGEEGEGEKRARAVATEKAALEMWKGLLSKTQGPHLMVSPI